MTKYSIVWTYHILFTHSSVYRHLSHFHFLAILNNAAMNICIHVFKKIRVLNSLWYNLRMESLGCMLTLCLTFSGTANCFPKWLNHFTFLPAVYEYSNFLHHFQNFLLLVFFTMPIPVDMKDISLQF